MARGKYEVDPLYPTGTDTISRAAVAIMPLVTLVYLESPGTVLVVPSKRRAFDMTAGDNDCTEKAVECSHDIHIRMQPGGQCGMR